MRHETMARAGKHGAAATGIGYWANGGWVGGGQPMPMTYRGQHAVAHRRSRGIGAALGSIATIRQNARARVGAAMLNVGIRPGDPRSSCKYNPGHLSCGAGYAPAKSAWKDEFGRPLYCCMAAR
jgi:hypothetical protein